jgi:hypothetical protein
VWIMTVQVVWPGEVWQQEKGVQAGLGGQRRDLIRSLCVLRERRAETTRLNKGSE